jgi:hypothetical protein
MAAGGITGRPKTAICFVSEKIQTAYVDGYTARPEFFVSLHLTIFGRPASFEFLRQSGKGGGCGRDGCNVPDGQGARWMGW